LTVVSTPVSVGGVNQTKDITAIPMNTITTAATKKNGKRDNLLADLLKRVAEMQNTLDAINRKLAMPASGVRKPVDFKAMRDKAWSENTAPGNECAQTLAYLRGHIELEDLLSDDNAKKEKTAE
jgi:hypothetical protein